MKKRILIDVYIKFMPFLWFFRKVECMNSLSVAEAQSLTVAHRCSECSK